MKISRGSLAATTTLSVAAKARAGDSSRIELPTRLAPITMSLLNSREKGELLSFTFLLVVIPTFVPVRSSTSLLKTTFRAVGAKKQKQCCRNRRSNAIFTKHLIFFDPKALMMTAIRIMIHAPTTCLCTTYAMNILKYNSTYLPMRCKHAPDPPAAECTYAPTKYYLLRPAPITKESSKSQPWK